jgi:hypothetical protein
MAIMKEVNRVIKYTYPQLKITAIRGDGYVYFSDEDGFHTIASIYTNPTTTSTCDMVKMCVESIADVATEVAL